MENLHNYTSEELAKCPYHAQLNQAQNSNENENANSEISDNESDEAGTDSDRYDADTLENSEINTSGGA